MLILGLIDSKPSAAAVLEDGEVVAAIAEERLCRLKLASGMPRAAIDAVLQQSGARPRDIDLVAVAQRVSVFEPQPVAWNGWFDSNSAQKDRKLEHLSAVLAPALGRLPLAVGTHHILKKLASTPRLPKIRFLLRDQYQIAAPVRFFDHHYCHAATAFYCNDADPALVVTLDGGGDGRSGSVYVGEGSELQHTASVDSFHSLGNFYSYITELCGFRAEKDEGKITGLAANGSPVYAPQLREFIGYVDPGQIRYRVPMYHASALRKLRQRLPMDLDRADLAASVQLVLEEVTLNFIRYWLRTTGLRNLAVAGGVFANVKLNQRLHELEEVDSLFVYPAMDDSGLCIGSAMVATRARIDSSRLARERIPNLYLGRTWSDRELESAVAESGLRAIRPPNIHDEIAKILAAGRVVARFVGRMEFGPRALGHRSVLYQTTDTSVNDWLNQRLKRTEFMPFAPATLDREADQRYVNISKARDCARFMTVAFECTEKMRDESPGVIHSDGTARPQIVDRETAPDFHKTLSEYYRRTGIPSLVNTSFNMHEEPIVSSPSDAMISFKQAHLDYLAIGDWLVEAPGEPARKGNHR
jgi:carbamoyltransferase